MKLKRLVLLAGLVATSMTAQADWFGTLSGRSADPSNSPKLSVEGSFTTSGDYQNIGARVNYGVNDTLTVYGDFGLSEFGPDGNSFGLGVFYYLPALTQSSSAMGNLDTAIQANYHTADLDGLDFTGLGVALLISPKEAMNPENGLSWYANLGLTRLSFDFPTETIDIGFGVPAIRVGGGSVDETELQIGGGIYLPMGPGTLYAGADLIDEFIFGVGYRFGIQ